MDGMRAWLLFAGAAIGCGSSSGGSDDARPPIDAAGDGAPIDAAPLDGGPLDGAPPDAMPAPVTVHVLGRTSAGPAPGVPVLFHDSGGLLVGRTTTDALGTATGVVPDSGSITVVEAGPRFLTTIAGVSPGDDLLVGDIGTWDPPLRTTSVAVPSGPDPGDQYVVWGPCALSGFSATPVSVTLWSCAPTSGPVIAGAYRIGTGNSAMLRGYLYDPEVSLAPGGTATLAGPWLPPIAFEIDVTGVPIDVAGGTFNLTRYAGGHQLYLFQSGSITWTNGRSQIQVAGGGEGAVTEIGLEYEGTSPGRSTILEYRAGAPTSLTEDIAADAISRPLDVMIREGELTPGGPRSITGCDWTMPGAGDYDGFVVQVEAADPSFTVTRWTVVLPPAAAGPVQVQLPRLPDDLVPVWAGLAWQGARVRAVDTPAPSYAAFRRDAEPEQAWSWMRTPVAASKVRIAATY